MSFSRMYLTSFCKGVTLAVGGTIGYYAYWTEKKSHQVLPSKRGSLIIRLNEVRAAFFLARSKKMGGLGSTHTKTVAVLSSKDNPDKMQLELQKVKKTYFRGYLQEALQRDPIMLTTPVFAYHAHLPVTQDGKETEREGFIFSGSVSDLHSSKSREDILNGNYIRCSKLLDIVKPKVKNFPHYYLYHPSDTIITGTTDNTICEVLKKAILWDAAMLAANDNILTNDPIADTFVLDCHEDECTEIGDLTTMPHPVKEKILKKDFVVCNDFAWKRTLNSRGETTLFGSIVVGKKSQFSYVSPCSELQKIHKSKMEEKEQQKKTKHDVVAIYMDKL